MQWVGLVPFMVTAIIVAYVPGLVVGVVARLRGLQLVAMAPVLSVFLIAATAILASRMHIAWGVIPVVCFTVIVALALLAADWIRLRVLDSRPAQTQGVEHELIDEPSLSAATDRGASAREIATSVLPILVAVIIITWQFVHIVGSPSSFSDGYDNVFHLNAVRWIFDTHDASSLTITGMTSGGEPPSFYPAAWHGFVSLIGLMIGSSHVAFVYNAGIWIVMAMIWPIGFIYLVKVLVADSGFGLQMAIALLAPAVTVFLSPIAFNLMPYWFGLLLLAPVLASCARILGLGDDSSETAPLSFAVVVTVFGVGGLFMSHPSAVLTLVAFLAPMVLVWAWRGYSSLRHSDLPAARTYFWAAGVAMIIFAAIWAVGRTHLTRPPTNTFMQSVVQVLLVHPLTSRPYWLLAFFLIVGGVAMVMRPAWRWWWGPVAVAIVLFFAAANLQDSIVRKVLVSGYYQTVSRLSSLLGIVLLVMVAMGVVATWKAVGGWIERKPRLDRRWVKWLTVVVAWVVLFVGVQLTGPMAVAIKSGANHYTLTRNSILVDSDEYALMKQVPTIVPPDVRVANDPGDGSSLAYALFGIKVTMLDLIPPNTPDLVAIQQYLNVAAIDPSRVCPALRNLNVGFAFDFGPKEVDYGYAPYPGFANLSTAPGFVRVASKGHAVLYRIDACN